MAENSDLKTGADAVVSLPPLNSFRKITMIVYSYSAVPTGGKLTVTIGTQTSVVFITTAGQMNLPIPADGFDVPIGAAVSVTLANGGAGIQGSIVVSTKLGSVL